MGTPFPFRIGLSSNTFPGRSPEELLEIAAACGLDAVELLLEPPALYPDTLLEAGLDSLAAAGRDAGILFSVHAPMLAVNIATENPGVRGESVRQMEAAVDVCHALGGRTVVLHNGQLDWRSESSRSVCEPLNVESIRAILARARLRGVAVAVENIWAPEFLANSCARMDALFALLSDASVRMTLDVGHANIGRDLDDYIAAFAGRIGHVHLHDNDGMEDQHLPLGQGTVNPWKSLFPFLRGFEGTVTLEFSSRLSDPVGSLVDARLRLAEAMASLPADSAPRVPHAGGTA